MKNLLICVEFPDIQTINTTSEGLYSEYDLTLEYENDVKLPYVLFAGEKKTTKGKQTVFKKGALGKTSKVKHFNHSVFSCSACLRKHKIMLLFSDMPFIKHVACAKVNLYYRIKLVLITKMVELLL